MGRHLRSSKEAQHRVELKKGNLPIHSAPYLPGRKVRELGNQEINRMLAINVIAFTKTDWTSLITFVSKKDGTIPIEVDNWKLILVTIQRSYPIPIPRMDEWIDSPSEVTVFPTLQASSRYRQIENAEENRDKTAFTSQEALIIFTRMTFGLKNKSGTFQCAMDIQLTKVGLQLAFVY